MKTSFTVCQYGDHGHFYFPSPLLDLGDFLRKICDRDDAERFTEDLVAKGKITVQEAADGMTQFDASPLASRPTTANQTDAAPAPSHDTASDSEKVPNDGLGNVLPGLGDLFGDLLNLAFLSEPLPPKLIPSPLGGGWYLEIDGAIIFDAKSGEPILFTSSDEVHAVAANLTAKDNITIRQYVDISKVRKTTDFANLPSPASHKEFSISMPSAARAGGHPIVLLVNNVPVSKIERVSSEDVARQLILHWMNKFNIPLEQAKSMIETAVDSTRQFNYDIA